MGSVNRDYGLSHFNVTNAHNDWRIIIMKKYLNSIRSNKKGFTLIEMLLVLFIIAVLLLLILHLSIFENYYHVVSLMNIK